MKRIVRVFGAAGILAATTLGAGIFALPYVFKESGWLTGLLYLIFFGAALGFAHFLYGRIMRKNQEHQRLLGLTKTHFGKYAFAAAFLAIVGGLFLALVIYLILARTFMALIFPDAPGIAGLFAFWAFASLPLFLDIAWFAEVEFLGIALMAAIIIFLFVSPGNATGIAGLAPIRLNNAFLPFGPILFALAGWTAIEPMYEYEKNKNGGKGMWILPLAAGTAFVAALYFLFAVAINNSASVVSPDTISGLTNWPAWKLQFLGAFGLFAIWTSYVPIAREIRNSLENDVVLPLRVRLTFLTDQRGWASLIAVVFAPLALYFLGLNNFLTAVGVTGGIFLSVQYFFLVLVARKTLRLSRAEDFLARALGIVFILAAVYEAYYFLK